MHQWIESDDDEVQDALYWRQAFNCRTSQVSVRDNSFSLDYALSSYVSLTGRRLKQSVELTCKCRTPANPDKTLVGCTNAKCGNWLHYECLLHDALMDVYERLGTELPHKSEKKEESTVKLEENDQEQEHEHDTEMSQRPLTPTESKGEDKTPSATHVKRPEEDGHHRRLSSRRSESTSKAPTHTPTPGPPNSASQRSVKWSSSTTKKSRGKKMAEEKPYQGLFQATLRMKEGPMAWEITDLRPNIKGGDRTWTERAACLVCKHLID